MPKTPFTMDDFMAKWKRFCYELKEQGRENIFTALTKHAPSANGFAVSLVLENKVQEDYANSVKLDILDFLRKELNNYSITIDFIVEKSTAEKIAYTGREKFEKMAQTNPHIITLQQKLKLMIE
jgi:DNA polymerase III subunit gamma/tau